MICFLDDFRRASCCNGIGRYVLAYNAVGADYGTCTYGYTRHDRDLIANPNVVLYDNRAFGDDVSHSRWLLHVVEVRSTMRVVDNRNPPACKHIVANGNAICTADMQVLSEVAVVSYGYLRGELLLSVITPCCYDPASPDGRVVSDSDILGPFELNRVVHDEVLAGMFKVGKYPPCVKVMQEKIDLAMDFIPIDQMYTSEQYLDQRIDGFPYISVDRHEFQVYKFQMLFAVLLQSLEN